MAKTLDIVEVNEYSTAAIEAILEMKDGAAFTAQSGINEYSYVYDKGAIIELAYTAVTHNEPEELEYAPFEFIKYISDNKLTLSRA